MIREARPYDLQTLLDLTSKFLKEEDTGLVYDRVRARDTFEALIDSPHGLVLCYEVEGRVVGFLAGSISPSFCAFGNIAVEIGWFVEKSHRKGFAPIRMVKDFEKWAVNHGCTHISMAMAEGVTDLHDLYTRLGYRKAETTYVKGL